MFPDFLDSVSKKFLHEYAKWDLNLDELNKFLKNELMQSDFKKFSTKDQPGKPGLRISKVEYKKRSQDNIIFYKQIWSKFDL